MSTSKPTRGDIEIRMADIREALDAWDKALDGDSGDAEHEAACVLASELRYILMRYSAELGAMS